MLISAEIAESDPNFRNCPQYRKSQLFLNCLFADPSLGAVKSYDIRRSKKINHMIKYSNSDVIRNIVIMI